MQFFGTPKGMVVTGVVVALGGLVDLVAGQQSMALKIGLVVVGVALIVRGVLRARLAKP